MGLQISCSFSSLLCGGRDLGKRIMIPLVETRRETRYRKDFGMGGHYGYERIKKESKELLSKFFVPLEM